jgi:ferredoxin-NADP reductase
LNFWKHQFFVEKIVRETNNVISVYLGGKNIEKFNFEPGQYIVIRFLIKDLVWQAHPFSISSMPGNKSLRLTIKNSGDFTSMLNTEYRLPNTKVVVDGPYGEFVASKAKQKKILLLAGGVGVTPLRGLIEKFTALKNDVIMIYSSKSKEDAIFSKELSKYKIRHFYTGGGQRLNKEALSRLVFDIKKREAYICGSEGFNRDMNSLLKGLGIQHIHLEEFSY